MISALLASGRMEDVGMRVHHVLKSHPALRERWLCGESMATLVCAISNGASPSLGSSSSSAADHSKHVGFQVTASAIAARACFGNLDGKAAFAC